MREVAKHLSAFLLWNLVAGTFLLFVGPPVGLLGALALSAAMLWGYVLPRLDSSPRRRWATLRLRPLDQETLRWTLAAVPVFLFLAWSLGDLYLRLVPVPPASLNPFEGIMRTPWGRLSIAIFAIAVAPLVEEFVFRGLLQRHLERRWGPAFGIAGASALFAVVHLLPWVLPLHFMLGVLFGFAVYATRSIWTGVILHAANNTVAVIGGSLERKDADPVATLWEIGLTADAWVSLGILVLSCVAGWWLARRLWEAGRPARLRCA